jgi:hypothetical protein
MLGSPIPSISPSHNSDYNINRSYEAFSSFLKETDTVSIVPEMNTVECLSLST